MDIDHGTQLSYGNLGKPSFSTEINEWQFPRDHAAHPGLQVIAHENVCPPLLHRQSLGQTEHVERSLSRTADVRPSRINALAREYPELMPAVTLLPRLEQISQTTIELETLFDPLASDYIAHGTAGHEDNGRSGFRYRSTPILASAAGISKQLVRLTVIGKSFQALRLATETFHITTEQYYSNCPVFWIGDTKASILGLCFSETQSYQSFLGVRRQNGIEILMPTMKRTATYKPDIDPREIGTNERITASTLHPNFLVHVSLEYANDLFISNFLFNRADNTQCTIINTSGHISVLKIVKPQSLRRPWTVYRISETTLPSIETEQPSRDGWARLVYATDSILVAATRDTIRAFGVEGNVMEEIHLPPGIVSRHDLVLDLRCVLVDKIYICVLTSKKVVLLHLEVSNDEGSSKSYQSSFKLATSVLHYRDYEDLSLQLALEVTGNNLLVLIFSKILNLVTGFLFRLDTNRASHTVTDAFRLDISQFTDHPIPDSIDYHATLLNQIASLKVRKILSDFDFEEVKVKISSNQRPSLVQCLVMDGMNAVKCLKAQLFDMTPNNAILELSPSSHSPAEPPHKVNRVSLNAFVVEDDDSSTFHRDYSPVYDGGNNPPAEKQLIRSNFAFLAREVNRRLEVSYTEVQRLDSFESSLEELLQQRDNIETGVYTLSEFLSGPLPIDSIDVVSSKISKLLDNFQTLADQHTTLSDCLHKPSELPQHVTANSLVSSNMVNAMQSATGDCRALLVPIYEHLLNLYLHSLPSELAPVLKVSLEKMIRQAAMQLFLASHGVKPFVGDDIGPTSDEQAESPQVSEFVLPVRGKEFLIQEKPSSPRPQAARRSHSFSRPSSSASGYPPSSQLDSTTASEIPEVIGSTLSQYLNFRPTSPLHKSLRRAVPEWQVGVEPTGHEWRNISRSTSRESLRSVHKQRMPRKGKGKAKAVDVANDDMIQYEDHLDSRPGPKQDFLRSNYLVMSDPLANSQSLGPSSQMLPTLSQGTSGIGPSTRASQSLSSQIPRENHSLAVRQKRSVPGKKRPSGFR